MGFVLPPGKYDELGDEYRAIIPLVTELKNEVPKQILMLLDQQEITLGVPLEARVKKWKDIPEKLDRIALNLKSIRDLDDLIGLRMILLFSRDVDRVCNLINQNFRVLKRRDVQDRLSEDQFGYSSIHYIVELKREWLAVPTLSRMEGLRIEIQVRTLAQHIWAAASHVLQYKNEVNVPKPVRRSLARLAALLESVDVNLESVLSDREDYRQSLDITKATSELNVDFLSKLLDGLLPAINKSKDEDYPNLLTDLAYFGINNSQQLREIIANYLTDAIEEDQSMVRNISADLGNTSISGDPNFERLNTGVFMTHCGLVRIMLTLKDPAASNALKKKKWDEKMGEKG